MSKAYARFEQVTRWVVLVNRQRSILFPGLAFHRHFEAFPEASLDTPLTSHCVGRAFPEAFSFRCFAFDPSDTQMRQVPKANHNLMMFPPGQRVKGMCQAHPFLFPTVSVNYRVCHCNAPGGREVLENHAEVVMHDFAASLLVELERWMLIASPAMVDLNTFLDTAPDFGSNPSALEEVSKRLYNDEVPGVRPCMAAAEKTPALSREETHVCWELLTTVLCDCCGSFIRILPRSGDMGGYKRPWAITRSLQAHQPMLLTITARRLIFRGRAMT
jgi:hypothetical protein